MTGGGPFRLAPGQWTDARRWHCAWRRAWSNADASARTTHAADECLDAAELLASILLRALSGQSKQDVLTAP